MLSSYSAAAARLGVGCSGSPDGRSTSRLPPHLERLLFHRWQNSGDLVPVEIGRDPRIASPLNQSPQTEMTSVSWVIPKAQNGALAQPSTR
jgi:hypothetical protein